MTKDYQKLIADLDKLKERCESMAVLEKCVPWGEWAANLQEAMDIISDYEQVATSLGRMTEHYQQEEKPIYKSGVWCCPRCGKRIRDNHDHCHWCGKKVGWGR